MGTLASGNNLVKWLSVRLRTKWLWVRIPLQSHIDSLSKTSNCRLLEVTMFESFFVFDQKYYKQCDGVAMGSPLGPTLINMVRKLSKPV